MFEQKMVKVENFRFVLQKCTECGALFPVIYQFNEGCIAPFGFACDHVQFENAQFVPVGGAPTFEKWYEEQKSLRMSLVSNFA